MRTRGFTLIEVMVAGVVMAIAMMGAMGGLVAAQQELRRGQLYQVSMSLMEAKGQKLLLANKGALVSGAVAFPSPTPPAQLAIGASPWVPDPSSPGDPGGGAYFTLLPNGSVTPLSGITAGTACNSSSLPVGAYCREVLTTVGTPTGAAGPNGTAIFTQWYRISRKGDPLSKAMVYTEVFSQ